MTDGKSGFIRNKEDTITTYANSSRHALRVSDKDGKTILGVNEIYGDPGVNTTAPASEKQEAEETKEFPAQKVIIGAVAVAVVLGAIAISAVTTLKKKKAE